MVRVGADGPAAATTAAPGFWTAVDAIKSISDNLQTQKKKKKQPVTEPASK